MMMSVPKRILSQSTNSYIYEPQHALCLWAQSAFLDYRISRMIIRKTNETMVKKIKTERNSFACFRWSRVFCRFSQFGCAWSTETMACRWQCYTVCYAVWSRRPNPNDHLRDADEQSGQINTNNSINFMGAMVVILMKQFWWVGWIHELNV